MSKSGERPPVTVVIPTYNPNYSDLARTIESIGNQDYPVSEVVIVDGSDEPFEVNSGKVDVRTIRDQSLGTGAARRVGMESTDSPYVAHFDEDTVLLRDDYLSDAVSRLGKPGVSGAGGTVFPIRGNPTGRAVSLLDRFNPSTLGTHNVVHEKRLCDGGSCFAMDEGRGEDISIRQELQQHGRIERMGGQSTLKDLPTARQSAAQDLIVGIVSGAIAGSVTGWVRDRGKDALDRVAAEAEEDLTV